MANMNRDGVCALNRREQRRTNAHLSSGDGSRMAIRSRSKNEKARNRSGLAASPVRIVVVDDHRFMREVTAAMLRRHNSRYDVIAEVADAKGAIGACHRLSPDLVVLDINLPDASGIDIVPQIKKVSPRTRVLLCTAYVTDDRIVD